MFPRDEALTGVTRTRRLRKPEEKSPASLMTIAVSAFIASILRINAAKARVPCYEALQGIFPDWWLSPEEQAPASRIDGGIAVSAFEIVMIG